MSMPGDMGEGNYEDDEAWIEAEIAREMEALDSTDLDNEPEPDDAPVLDKNIDISEEDTEELSSDMQEYVRHMRAQTERLEKDLEECDELLHHTDTLVSTPRPDHQDLMELAKERGEDVFNLKKKVLEELDREDEIDERMKLESVNENELEVNLQLKDDGAYDAESRNNNNAVDINQREGALEQDGPEEGNGPAFLTAPEEHRPTEEEEYQELKRRILGEPRPEVEVEDDSEDEEIIATERDTQEGTLKPGEGVVMAAIDSQALEQKILREVFEWEDKWLEKNHRRQEDVKRWTEEETMKMEEVAGKRDDKIRGVQQEQEVLHKQQEETQAKLQKESDDVQQEIQESLNKYQTEYDEVAGSVREESEALVQEKESNFKKEEDNLRKSATKIQACYRGYRIYKEKGREVKAHLDAWKERKTQARITALEESRKKKADDRKRIEEEEQRREEYMLKKEQDKKRLEEEKKKTAEEKAMEKQRKAEEEELKRKEEEQRKLEEEQRRAEEQKRKEEEKRMEEKRKKEEERKKIEEEERKKREEEEKRKEEARQKDEKKRKMVEEQMKAAEEKRLLELKNKEEEANRIVEEKRKKEERKKREEETKAIENKKAEEEKLKRMGLDTVHSPVPPEGKPKTPRKKVNELRKSAMSPLANGSRSPSMDSDSDTAKVQVGPMRDTEVRQSVRASRTDSLHASVTSMPPNSARSDVGKLLPDIIEKHRLDWMHKCQPWSKTAQSLKSKKTNAANRRPLRRPISAKNISPLLDSTVIQSAGVTSLQQVTTVELHDLPGCSLKVLGQCPRLRALRINNSHIVSTEGMEACKELTYLDLKHNALETVTLRDHQKLMYIDVSHNCLTSLLGLESCANLQHINASHNRITRINGLEGVTSLHTLDLSNNQLITTKGLSAAPTIQHLNLSQNHLPSLDDIEKLGLLQVLKVSGNNILQPPILKNHVLLRTLLLDDNSLCSLRNLTLSWLPLLRLLNTAQNSLSSLDDIGNCVILQDIDVSSNQILDIESMTKGLHQNCHLQKLRADGNPVTEDADFRPKLQQALPWLKRLDNNKITPIKIRDTITDFENMCIEQVSACDKVQEDFNRKVSKTRDLGQTTSVHSQFYKVSHKMAVDHRYKHEYGDSGLNVSNSVTTSDPDSDLDIDLTPAQVSTTSVVQKSDASEMKNKFEMALQNMNGARSSSATAVPPSAPRKASPKKVRQDKSLGSPMEHLAATRIQALWRGYAIRRDIELHSRWWMAATTIQAAWRGHFVRKVLEEMGYGPSSRGAWRHEAATKIQALWRGYRMRKRIENALNYARTFDDMDDLDDEMNFKEVDLSAFDFNEDDLERGWTPPDTPQIPANYAALNSVPSASSGHQAMSAKAAFDAVVSQRPPHPPNLPRQAWRNFDSPVSDTPYGSAKRPPLPPVSRLSDVSGSEHTGATTQRTHRSRKEEKLSEEWGFKDTRTAEMMMKRAKKLHYNSQRKKKLGQLDPKQRLALFRKLEESTTRPQVQPPPKKVLPRKEYFQDQGSISMLERRSASLPDMLGSAREDAVRDEQVVKQRDRADTNKRCFEWVHTQVGSYEVGTSRINQRLNDAAIYNSENLPLIDPNVIAGARPTLTGSPMSMELQSLDSVSTAGDLQRRNSSAGDAGSRLPPIKGGSVPATHSKVDRPERMSFRNPKPKTMESIGWGGGKKRSGRR